MTHTDDPISQSPQPASPLGDAAGDPPAADDAPAIESLSPDALREALRDARDRSEEYLGHLKRERADFTNYRRRVDDERAQAAQSANLGLVMKLLPILDDFERALGNASPDELETSWAKGVQLIERNLRAVLVAEGVERIDPNGAGFNPWEHEAVTYQPSAEAQDGTVLHVIRPGYRRGDRIIRPAQVVVGRANEDATRQGAA